MGKERCRLSLRPLRSAKTGKGSAVTSVTRGVSPDIKDLVAGLESQITGDEEGPGLPFDRTCESERFQEADDGFKDFTSRGLVATPSGGMNPIVEATTKVVPSYEGQKSTASQATVISSLRDTGCSVFCCWLVYWIFVLKTVDGVSRKDYPNCVVCTVTEHGQSIHC